MLLDIILILLVIWLIVIEVRLHGWKGLIVESRELAESAEAKAKKALAGLGIKHQSRR
jgi:hypothetical protein